MIPHCHSNPEALSDDRTFLLAAEGQCLSSRSSPDYVSCTQTLQRTLATNICHVK